MPRSGRSLVPKSINAYLTKEKMTWISAGMEVIHRGIARPAGTLLESVDMGKPAFRAHILRDKLLAGQILDKGETFETMAGYRDDELGVAAASKSNTRTRQRGNCKDCGTDIRPKELRLKSDLARCIPCARKKKAQYNQNYRGRA